MAGTNEQVNRSTTLLPSENEESLTQEIVIGVSQDLDIIDGISDQDLGDLQEDLEQTWISSSKKKLGRKKKGSKVTIATRASNRISNDGRSMLEKAAK